MALYATNRFAGDGVTTSYEFNFVGKYIARRHVKVYQEDNATGARTPVAITDSNFLNDTTLRNLPVTPVGKTLVIYRDTPKPPLVDFTNGARLTEANLDTATRQGSFIAVESADALSPDGMAGFINYLEGFSIGAETARDQAAASAGQAAASAGQAAASAGQAAASASMAATRAADARASAVAAELARENAIAAAGAIGPIKFYDTYAQALAAIGELASGDLIEVAQDETRADARTRYRVQAGALVFVTDLDHVRVALAADTGASLVGIKRPLAGAVASTLALWHEATWVNAVADYAITGDGTEADMLRIEAAMAATTGVLLFPPGSFTLSRPLAPYTGNNLRIVGSGAGATTFSCTFAGGDIFCFGDGTANPNNCSIEHLSITSTVAKTSGAAIRFRNGHNLKASHIRLDNNLHFGIQLDGGAQQFLYYLSHFEINSGSAAGIVIGEDGTLVQDIWINTGVVSQCRGGIVLKHLSGLYMSEVDVLGATDSGVVTYPGPGKKVVAVWADTVIADTCNSHGWKIITGDGLVANWTMTACWGASCGVTDNGHGMYFSTGIGSIQGISLTGPRCVNNKGSGILIESGDGITIVNPQCLSNSQQGFGIKHGIEIGPGVSRWSIMGGICGQGGRFDTNWQAYGIYIHPGSSVFYNIAGVNVLGNVAGGIMDGGSGVTKHISENIGYRTAKRDAGAIRAGASSAVISHELDVTPGTADIIVSPVVDPGGAGISRFWVSATTATTFTVSCTPAATGDFFFAWDARVKGA